MSDSAKYRLLHIQKFLDQAKSKNKNCGVADTYYPGLTSSDVEIHSLLKFAAKHRKAEDFLVVGDTIAKGGMSSILSAEQTSVDRKVVVKIPSDMEKNNEARNFMLREARITAKLEHPHIIPVYDIATDKNKVPMIVMRHVQGETWQEWIRKPDKISRAFGAMNTLQWNLKILVQVAKAVEFAHSKGVVHRDIKPGNVLIGAQGEAYLFDWGIAFESKASEDEQNIGIAGTPAYIAPEMLDGNSKRIGPHTDVFLLGAVLYEMMAGYAPFQADTLVEAIDLARRGDPSFDLDYPDELVEICKNALRPKIENRTPNVKTFIKQLEAFFEHLHSITLETMASGATEKLRTKLDFVNLDNEKEKTEVYRLFEECKFGFSNSLSLWSENRNAAQGLNSVVSRMIKAELQHGDPDAAATILASTQIEFPKLSEQVRAARISARKKTEAQGQAFETNKKQSSGLYLKARQWIFFGIMLSLALMPAVIGVRDHWGYIKSSTVYLVGLLLFGIYSRDAFFASMYNRRSAACLVGALLTKIIISIAALKFGVAESAVASHHMLMMMVVVTIVASALEWKFVYAVPAYVIGYVWTLADPTALPYCESFGHFFFACTAFFLWRKPKSND